MGYNDRTFGHRLSDYPGVGYRKELASLMRLVVGNDAIRDPSIGILYICVRLNE